MHSEEEEDVDGGLGDDFREKAWKAPEVAKAKAHRARMLWRGGKQKLAAVTVEELGRLGSGIELYFSTLRFLAALFFACFILSLPQITISSSQNGGHAMSYTERAQLSGMEEFIVSLSLGGQGVHRDTVGSDYQVYSMERAPHGDEPNDFGLLPCSCDSVQGFATGEAYCRDDGISDCQLSCPTNATQDDDVVDCSDHHGIHCGWSSVSLDILGLGWQAYDAIGVAYFQTFFEFVVCVLLVASASLYRKWVEKVVEDNDRSNATPNDYTVFVRGLPTDVTTEEILHHFSSIYDLHRNECPHYPMLGMAIEGGAVVRGCQAALVWAIVVSPGVYSALVYSNVNLNPVVAGLLNFVVIVLFGCLCALLCRRYFTVGLAPVPRETVQQRYDRELAELLEERERYRNSKNWGALLLHHLRGGCDRQVAPEPTGPEEGLAAAPAVKFSARLRFLEHHRKQQPSPLRMTKGQTRVLPVIGHAPPETASSSALPSAGGPNPFLEEVLSEEGGLPARPDPQPVQDAIGPLGDLFVGTWVAQIALCHPLGPARAAFSHSNQTKIKKVFKLKARIQKHGPLTQLPSGANPAKVKHLEKKLGHLEAKLKKVDEACTAAPELHKLVNGAFVTFEHEESMLRCLEDYRWTNSLWLGGLVKMAQPAPLMFKHPTLKHRKTGRPLTFPLQVSVAPEPSNVLWENVEVTAWNRLFRRTLTALVTFVLLLGTFVFIVVLNEFKTRYDNNVPDTEVCLYGIPATYFGAYPETGSFHASFVINASLSDGKQCDECCSEGEYYLLLVNSSTVDRSDWLGEKYTGTNRLALDPSRGLAPLEDPRGNQWPRSKASLLTTDDDLERANLCDDNCFDPDDDSSECATPTCYASDDACYSSALAETFNSSSQYGNRMCMQEWFYKDTVSNACESYTAQQLGYCYCLQELNFAWSELSFADLFSKLGKFLDIPHNDAICYNIFVAEITSVVLGLVILGVVLVLNVLLKEVLEQLSEYEAHASVAEQTRSLVGKLFVAQVMNTTVLGLLVNSNYTGEVMVIKMVRQFLDQLGLPVLQGADSDFTHEWFVTQGKAVVMTMLLQVLVPHISPLVKSLLVQPVKRFVAIRGVLPAARAASQRELNEVYEGGKFAIHTRYAFVLNFLFIALFYSGGIPAMHLLAALNFLLTYAFDKLLVVKYLNRPPQYDSQLAQLFSSYFPMAVLLHLGATGYMFANDDILRTNYWTIPRCLADSGTSNEYLQVLNHFIDKFLARANVFPISLLVILWAAHAVLFALFGKSMMRLFQAVEMGLGLRGLAPTTSVTARQPGWTAEVPDRPAVPLRRSSSSRQEHRKSGTVEPGAGHTDCFFQADGLVEGKFHRRGQRKRVWEAMSEDGLHDYCMHKNPNYKDVVALLRRAGYDAANDGKRPSIPDAASSSARALEDASIHQPTDTAAPAPAPAARSGSAPTAETAPRPQGILAPNQAEEMAASAGTTHEGPRDRECPPAAADVAR